MDVLVRMKTLISLNIFIRALGCPGALSMSSNILKRTFFSEPQVSTVGLQYSVNHVVNRLALIQALWFRLQSVCILSCFSRDSLQPHGLYVTHQAPLLMGFSRQEYCKSIAVGCHALLQGLFLTQELNPCLLFVSCIAGRFFTTKLLGKTSFIEHAAAAASLQSCPTLCDPIDSSPPGSPVPGILQARTLEHRQNQFSIILKGPKLFRIVDKH